MDPFIIANFIPCFHCVKLHYSALMQLRDRTSERERTDQHSLSVFFVRFNGAHRFSLAPEQFLVYINANRLPLAFGTNQTPWQMASSLCLSPFPSAHVPLEDPAAISS